MVGPYYAASCVLPSAAMRWRVLLALLLVTGLVHAAGNDPLPTAKPEDVGLSSARLERLAQVLRGDIDHGRMPGAVIAITRKGKLAYYESFGFLDKAAGTPMPKDAIFALASMTKPMAAVAALMLAERGELLLNDPVGNYLPALKDMKVATATGTEPARRQPTLQDMMRHTAGVTYGNQGTTELHKRYPSGQRQRHDDRIAVPRDAWQAAAALSARHDVGLQLRPRRDRAGGRGGDEAAARRLPAGATVRAARHGRHAVRRARGESRADRQAAAARSRHRAAPTFREPVKPWQFDCGGGCAQGRRSTTCDSP